MPARTGFRLTRRTALLLLAVLAALAVSLWPAPAGLTPAAMRALGLLVGAIICWAGSVMDDYVVAMFMGVGWIILRVVPFKVAFATFALTNYWMMAGALGVGVAVAQSGLLRRVALLTLRALPPTFAGQVAGLVGAGVMLGPTLPSVVGKTAIAGKFVLGIHEAMGLQDRSAHSTGLYMAMLLGFGTMGPLFMSGTVTNFVILGLLPAEVKANITWISWFVTYLPTMLVILALSLLAVLVVCRPQRVVPLSREYLSGELAALGPLSRSERITLATLSVTLLLWVTGQWHGIDAATVALTAVAFLSAVGIIDRSAFQSKIAWSAMMFMGFALNLAQVFPYLKIDAWLGTKILPVFAPLTARPAVFFGALMLMVVLIRQIMVSWDATITIVMLILSPAVAAVGINPWTVGIATHLVAQVCWILPFQHNAYAVSHQAADERLADQRRATLLSLISIAIVMLAVEASLPWWRLRGLLP
ncbi:MAG: SLC13 family permease [Chloroflexota bacterium]